MVNEAKKTAKIILQGCGISFDRLTARTVSFMDLARESCVFVTVKGAKASGTYAAFDLAKAKAKEHGFRIQFSQF